PVCHARISVCLRWLSAVVVRRWRPKKGLLGPRSALPFSHIAARRANGNRAARRTRRPGMEIDRRAFLATLGSTAVINRMPDEEKAEALEHYMTNMLDEQATGNELIVRRGTGDLFGSQPNGPQGPSGAPRPVKILERMPDKPTLLDFFKYRF